MAEAGRFHHEAAGAIKDRPEAERAEAHEQLGPPFVHVWVASLRSLAATKGLAPEHVLTVKTYWEGQRGEELASAIGGARAALSGRSRAGRSMARKGGRASCSASVRLLSHSSQHWKQRCCCRKESGGTARPLEDPLEREASKLLAQMQGEVERLARILEVVSQRMADLLRPGVLEPSFVYGFLMKKGGQQVTEAKTKA